MPPEQLPWDRRDFRKHDRSGSDPRFLGGGFGGGGPHRWREQHHHPHAPPPHPPPYHHNNHQQQQRWYSDFRSSRPIPSGHGKQGGWHMYPDDAGHGFLPFGSRYSDRNVEDDNFRPFASRGDARYFRNSRENRGSFSQKDWRSPSGEPAASSSGPGRPTNDVNNHKSVENTETCQENNSKSNSTAHLLPDSVPDQSQSPVKENHEKNGGAADGLASLDQKSEKENGLGSMDWKPLKWSRSGSLSSRSSGFSHSSSSKSLGVDSEIVVDVQQNNVLPAQSPAAVCVLPTAPAASDETSSRKKPRLGWGEGLAKYEKKKVGPEEVSPKDVQVCSVSDTEMMQLPSVNLLEKSPRVATLSDCTSPATPSSVACSFSPGVDEKESIKAANNDHEATNLSCSPCPMPRTHYDGPTFSLESLELTSIANLSSLINELLQPDDQSSAETGYVRTTSMNKLLVWKVNILKAIEVTESEIDSLETELKSLLAEPTGSCPNPAASCLLPEECRKSCEERVTGSSVTIGPAPSQVVTSGAMISENLPAAVEDAHVALKDEIDSPGSATSKLIEVLPSGEDTFPSGTPQCDERFASLDLNNSRNLEKCLGNDSSTEDETCSSDDHKLIERNCQNFTSVGSAYRDIDHIYQTLLSSNKDSINMAIDELNKLMPSGQRSYPASRVSSLQRDSSVIKERFLVRKRSLRLKEKVITLKFKVFQHFWKEGRVVSIRKLRGKSHKKFDLGRTGCKKNRSSGRSRLSYTSGSPRTVPAEEVIEFINQLLSESPFKLCRRTLKMPALILDKDVRMSKFVSINALVEDPCAVEKERSMINRWTAEERELFIDKLAIFGKDFPKIASFLERKRVADCIEFYYKNHKSEDFARARKKLDSATQRKSQSSTYLVAAGKRWSREANAASLDILGEASVIAASVNDGIEAQQKCTSKIFIGASSSHRAPRSEDGPLLRSNSLDMYSNETVAADVLAGICGSLSSEAMSSCITTSVDLVDGYQDRKNQRISSCVKWPWTPDVTQNVDDECSDESCGEMDPTDWTDEEKSIFIQAVSSYGKDFMKISRCVRTRSREQCKIFFSKARKCLGLDQIQPGVGNVVSGNVNGGGSDTEDACVVQNSPVVCNDGSDCKMDENRTPAEMKLIHKSGIGGEDNLKPNFSTCVDNVAPSTFDSMAVEPLSNNFSSGDTVLNHNSAVNSNVDSKERDGAGGCEIEVRTLTASFNTEPVGVEGDNCVKPSGSSEGENKAVAEVSVGHHGEEDNEGRSAFLPEDNSESKKVEGNDAISTEMAVVTSSLNGMKSESQVAENISHHSVDLHSSVQIEPGQRIEADLQTFNTEKSRAISLEQNGRFSSMESSMLFSVPIKYQRHSSSNARSSSGANGTSEKNPEKILRTVDCQQHVSGYSRSDPVEYSQILRGYPVSVQTLKEINGDINCKKHLPLQNVPMQDEKLYSGRCADFSLQKCTRPKHQSEVLQAPFQSQDRSRDHSRPRSGSSSDADKPSRSGDVKLFGKILTSSQQKPDSWVLGKGDSEQHRRSDSQTLNLRFNQKVNLDTSQSKFDCNNYAGSENIPVRSFSFWDGNRGDTGFPHLADSALLLAKYPAAFSNHSSPTVKLDNPLNSVSVFPNREMSSSNGVADYQVLRNRELQPFGLDIKQTHEVLFSEMQRRNGFDVGPGMQQQARGMVGINIVGRGGLLGGGQCSGVSDPVAAIKMHYAKAQNLSMQAGNGVREDDTWTSNGDIGR